MTEDLIEVKCKRYIKSDFLVDTNLCATHFIDCPMFVLNKHKTNVCHGVLFLDWIRYILFKQAEGSMINKSKARNIR